MDDVTRVQEITTEIMAQRNAQASQPLRNSNFIGSFTRHRVEPLPVDAVAVRAPADG
jgi:hypothetical protein